MSSPGWVRRLAMIAGLGTALAVLAAPPAGAHPLGNFTVNHHDGLTVHADRVELHAVVDSAEIPTRQELPSVDTDGDDVVSTREGEAYALDQCDQLSRAITSDVDGTPLRFAVRTAVVRYPPGEGNLPTTRLVCELTAPADPGRRGHPVVPGHIPGRPDRMAGDHRDRGRRRPARLTGPGPEHQRRIAELPRGSAHRPA